MFFIWSKILKYNRKLFFKINSILSYYSSLILFISKLKKKRKRGIRKPKIIWANKHAQDKIHISSLFISKLKFSIHSWKRYQNYNILYKNKNYWTVKCDNFPLFYLWLNQIKFISLYLQFSFFFFQRFYTTSALLSLHHKNKIYTRRSWGMFKKQKQKKKNQNKKEIQPWTVIFKSCIVSCICIIVNHFNMILVSILFVSCFSVSITKTKNSPEIKEK